MLITEEQFRIQLRLCVADVKAGAVTGPGRSGAIAAVYASYLLGIPFVPFGHHFPGPLLLLDTVSQTGKTLRRATAKLVRLGNTVTVRSVYSQQERLRFWYENQRP